LNLFFLSGTSLRKTLYSSAMLGFRASFHSEIPAFNLDTLLFHRSLHPISSKYLFSPKKIRSWNLFIYPG